MTYGELIAKLREDVLDDNKEPYIWSDDTLFRYIQEAEDDACKRGALIVDSTTPEVTQITLTEGVSLYLLHPTIQTVYSVNLNGVFLEHYSPQSFEYFFPDISTTTYRDTPRYFCIPEWTSIQVAPIPKEAGTLNLRVSRTPLPDKSEGDEMEIPASFQEYLKYGAAARCYNKQDTDAYNGRKAMEFEALFTTYFGEPFSVKSAYRKKRYTATSRTRPQTNILGFP